MKDTSKEAYEAVKPKLPLQREEVLRCLSLTTAYIKRGLVTGDEYYFANNTISHLTLLKFGACTMRHLSELWNLDYYMCQRRISELVERGLVRDSGKRAKTSTGRSAVIWEVTE